MEATDPERYMDKKERMRQEEERVKEEYLKQFMSYESPMVRINNETEDKREEEFSPDPSYFQHMGSFEFENKGFLPVIVEDSGADAETDANVEISESKFSKRNPRLTI